ncbi:MAG TPA: patatin-like phospholipase family protein, partial [Pyrinomonadaceae bacterium]|nr:patatin-like phospholipase family protein [Pyrinomonadaceae bacterium]
MKAFGVFEGGGAKGYAHVGALQAIEGRGIHLKAVAGSSVGAVIALLIAAGFSADELINKIAQDDWIDRLNRRDWAAFKKLDNEYRSNRLPQVPSRLGVVNVLKMGGSIISAFYRHSHLFKQIWTHYGITDADGIRQWLNDAICQKLGIAGGPVLFRDLKIPLKVVAGDLLSGKMRVFGGDEDADINAVDAAVASASYPLFFQPFPFERSLFVDGGLLSNLPVWVFDEERQKQLKLTPTFGFRFVDVPLLGPAPTYQPPSSFPGFIKRLVSTSVFGGQAVGTRAIDEYYTFDLAADIDTLAFHEIKEKAGGLVETGRKGVAKFFDTQIGPSDPDDMEILLGVFCNFIVQALDRTAKQKLPRLRAFILIENSPDFVKVVYSA